MKPLPLPLAPAPAPCCSDTTAGSTCCSPAPSEITLPKASWITGTVATPLRPVPVAATRLSRADHLGAWKVRWGIGRMNYRVEPGLYAVGNPAADSPVLVTANYKLSFDSLRRELSDIAAWILVLDTKGINVWCAAGKGTFGTAELVNRLKVTGLSDIVSHRTVILPQLGAPGVSAHAVAKQSGFKVVYGPVRAADIPTFLKNGLQADAAMRTVNFTLWDRLVLTPYELTAALKPSLYAFGVLYVLNALGLTAFGLWELAAVLGAVIGGAVLAPALLPWIPGRAFAFKGALLGLLGAGMLISLTGAGALAAAAYLLLMPAIAAWLAMNFTGCSTYTSFSGVKEEMRIAVPIILIAGALGTVALVVDGVLR